MVFPTQVIRKTGRVLLYLFLGVILIVLLFLVFINTDTGKNVVRKQVVQYLQNTLHSKVSIAQIDYSLPQWIELTNLYVQDQKNDSLLYAKKLRVNISMFKLLRGNTDIQKLEMENVFINIKKAESDSVFNFEFIVDAFTGNKLATANVDTAEMKISLDKLLCKQVIFIMDDQQSGNRFSGSIKSLDASLHKFQPDRLNFGIDQLNATGIDYSMLTTKPSVQDTSTDIIPDSLKKEATYGLYITANRFAVNDVTVDIENSITGMQYKNNLKELKLTNGIFNLEQTIIKGDSLLLKEGYILYKSALESKLPEDILIKAPADTQSKAWYIEAEQVNVTDIDFAYNDANSPHASGFDPAHIDMQGINGNISRFLFSSDSSRANINQLAFRDTSGLKLDSTHARIVFTNQMLQASELYIQTEKSLIQNFIQLSYDSLSGITLHPQNSLLQAKLNGTVIAFNELYLLMPALKNSFPPHEFANKQVRFNTELRGTLQRVYLPYLELNGLDGSSLSARGTLYNLTDARRFSYDLYIDRGHILKKDILKFVPPENREQLKELPAVISIQGHLKGNSNELVADIISNAPGFAFNGKILLNNMQDPENIQYGFAAKRISINRQTLLGFIPPGSLPDQIQLPAWVQGSGSFKGTASGFESDLNLQTDYGNVGVKGFLNNYADLHNAKYNLKINTGGFNIGKLLGQDSVLGTVSADVNAVGTGFDYKTMNSTVDMNLHSLQYNNYTYQNARVHAVFDDGMLNSNGRINDSNLIVQYDLASNMQSAYPTLIGFVDVDTARLHPLNLVKDTLNFSMYTSLDAQSTMPRALNVHALIDSLRMQKGLTQFVVDTIALTGSSEAGVDDIRFESPFAFVHARGAFDYDKVGNTILNYLNGYYPITETKPDQTTEPQQLEFEASVAEHALLKSFIPGLIDYDSMYFSGTYASAQTDSALQFKGNIPYVQYRNNVISRGELDIRSKNEKINYWVKADTIQMNAMSFYGTRIQGAAASDSISFHAITQDEKAKDWFSIQADFYQQDEQFYFRLKDSLLLNYEEWHVQPGNYIRYGSEGLVVNKFLIQSDTANMAAQSQSLTPNSGIDIQINNFNLQSISSLISGDTLFASGILDADILVNELNNKLPAFTGTASIHNLVLMEQPVGNIVAEAQKKSDETITANLKLTGNNNDVSLQGSYYLNNIDNQFNADLNLNRLNLATLQGFTIGQLKNASGNLRGKINLTGKFTKPEWRGNLYFDSSRFTLSEYGAPFNIHDQKIEFDYPNIRFNQFIIKDSLNHNLIVDGTIHSNLLTAYDLNLDLKANDFIVMNAKSTVNNELYGFAQVNADIQINGTAELPRMEGLLKLNERSDVTLVLPETNYQKDEGLSVVKFIDTDTFDVYKPPTEFTEAERERVAFGRYLNYNFTIEVAKAATFSIIVDPSTGDELEVQGYALLNAGVDPGGNLVLSGNYELDQGHYNFSYQFLSRKFDLRKGSYITFSGSPMDATVNITAAYTVLTNSRGLLGSEITSTSRLSNLLNQKLPYTLLMHLTGVLSRPTIKFSISLPEGTANVNSELQTTIDNKLAQLSADETAMNRQAFSLLLFNRFVGEQSSDFFKGNGTNFSDLARQSVSQFLSSAIDNIAGDLIKGIDIDLALSSYEDYSAEGGSQQRTDLKLALSKKFINDRLTVTVGKNFGLEGQDANSRANTARSSSIFPDFSASYQLSADGKYMIKGYRKNEYEAILDGYVIENGVSFVVALDYDKFIELFKRKKKPAIITTPAVIQNKPE